MLSFSEIVTKIRNDILPGSPKAEIREAGGGSVKISPNNLDKFIVKAVGNIDSQNVDFAPAEVDLNEISDAIGADSYIALAISKYSELVFKAGYNIVSENDDAALYVRNRLDMMSFMTQTPIDVVLQGVAEDLIRYSNAFLIKSRYDQGSNIGGLQAKGVFSDQPVGGYFRVDPATMSIKRDKTGTIKQYQQEVGSNKKKYKPEDVVHFYINKKAGDAFGTPKISAALEDVKMLRKMEGNMLRQTYRYSMPLMQMQIGLPQAGLMATDKQINDATKEVERFSDDGIFVTNESTNFKTIGVDGQALDLSKSIAYCEARVLSALGLSTAMIGRGGAKQDADSMEEQVHNTIKFVQRSISTFIESKIFMELLLEGGYDPLSNPEDKVFFQFEEINLETKVKMQTHALNMFQGNLIPFEEARTQIGMQTDNVDESRLFSNMIQLPTDMALVQAKANASTGNGPVKKTTPNGTAKSTVQPKNQSGTHSANIKESLTFNESTKNNIASYRKNFNAVYKSYSAGRNNVCEDVKKAYIVLPLTRDSIKSKLFDYIDEKAIEGFKKAVSDAGEVPEMEPTVISAVLKRRTEKHLKEMFEDISKKIKAAKTRDEIEAAFNSSEYRIRFLSEHVAEKAYWYAYVKTCQALKIPAVYVKFHSSEDKEEHSSVIHPSHFSLDDIPAFHPYCKCTLGQKR